MNSSCCLIKSEYRASRRSHSRTCTWRPESSPSTTRTRQRFFSRRRNNARPVGRDRRSQSCSGNLRNTSRSIARRINWSDFYCMARVLLLVAYYLLSNLIRAELIPALIRQVSAKPTIYRKEYPTSKDSPVYYMYACINKEWVTMANSRARFPDPCRIFRHACGQSWIQSYDI